MMTTMITRIFSGSLLLAASFVMSGCLALTFGGGSKAVETPPPTVGQELIDLKQALDEGALTEVEYEAQKARVLRRK